MISNIIASIEESCFFFPQDFPVVQQIMDGRVEGERERVIPGPKFALPIVVLVSPSHLLLPTPISTPRGLRDPWL